MLCVDRHKGPSVAQFTFDCYRHWYTLVIRDLEGSGQLFHKKEGVTQGDPLSMIKYGIGVLPCIQELWNAHPHVT